MPLVIISRAPDGKNTLAVHQYIPYVRYMVLNTFAPCTIQGCVFWADFLDLQEEVWHQSTFLGNGQAAAALS